MATSSHLDSLFALQGIGSFAITKAGSAEQRATWLPRVAAGEVLAGLALTEPDAGSDLKNVVTGDGGRPDPGCRFDGSKSYISNGAAAAFFEVFAQRGYGYSMVLVPADAPASR